MAIVSHEILPLFAGLNPDGTIELEVGMPDLDEPNTVQVPATDESRRLARPDCQRTIDLDAVCGNA